tara:strand:+ start:1830 stop:2009 length:180 start_codon:yes stop_codon:yes gene_type:complete
VDQAGIDSKTVTADKAFRNAAGDDSFKYLAQQIAVPELAVHCLTGDCGAICREGDIWKR